MVLALLCCWFFFSSRRRHTRWPRDWSSDVCSSDLLPRVAVVSTGNELRQTGESLDEGKIPDSNSRSEERRVGKECRSRSSGYHRKEKRAWQKTMQKSRKTQYPQQL